jgi:hypothetical protein
MDEREAVSRLVEFAMAAMDRDGVRPEVLVKAVEAGGRLVDELGWRAPAVSSPPDAEAESGVGPDGQIPDASGVPGGAGPAAPGRVPRSVHATLDPNLLRRVPSPPPTQGNRGPAVVEVPATKPAVRPHPA